MSKLTTASVLAFERNLDISDAFFAQVDSTAKNKKTIAVSIKEKSVRGTISNRLKKKDKQDAEKDHTKLDAEIQNANLQRVDAAALDESCDTLLVSWSCKVLPFTGKPNVCNDQDYQKALEKTVADYLSTQGVAELARRYAINIANARWLWRNRVGAEKIKVKVTCNQDEFEFDAKQITLQNFDIQNENITKLAKLIEKGLIGESFIILYITATAKMGYGQEVYPSQELVLDTGKTKSKVLYEINGKAGMHSQKVSNAIRTIDDWYPGAEFPIAIEPYGAVTTMGKAFRQPKQKMDFYTLFDDWVLKGKEPDVEQQHYVIGVLIRGGVFGASGKE
ncbi:type I-F CRISPR-associated protein Csy3 [Pasteurella atlantica]|uniref:type I-F CRISPR-associated protein Csy3 n=1 Tax=Pasteurellaceae TaxID=712 RepID=UPI00275D098E|nr:type I-F CRISPR-associated protein Csy3 [Pasteurella atlantica]MDP8033406.1 type I-F CRISPR-associated protein Csy3 [Pasteurella atlantica]MDP8035342.1 type I-F CRISPR-associated protein Csy3 [Pasteurella atlantica]MDP8037292.1 type I-F CRISPR-associated protein Csy3 [Pasteurella atlantica]MDP8047594.1 type I-F CRISPR-associated protein Csy3 [Pasteurella atlantica]MDP8049595.1 type I-F CRISPR-associated protein Csy3 [Pasteurella atlantica]